METKNTLEYLSLKDLLKILPGSAYWKDKNGVYQGCNEYMLELIGTTRMSDAIGKTDFDFAKALGWPPGIAESFRKVDAEVIASGKPILNVQEPPFNIFGNKVMYQLTNRVPLRNQQGEVIGMLGISFDITELKNNQQFLTVAKEKAEEQAKNAFLNLEQIIACMPGSVYWKDKNGVYQGCNEAVEKLFGAPKSEILGKTDYDFAEKLGLSKKLLAAVKAIDQEVIKSNIPKLNIEEHSFNSADGKRVNQLTNKVPLHDESNNVVGVVGISIDITELKDTQKRLAEQIKKTEAAYRSKGEFLATASHEIRNPIGSVITLQSLCKENLDQLQDIFYNEVFDILAKAKKPELIKKITHCFQDINKHHYYAQSEAQRSLNALVNLSVLYRLQMEGVETRYEMSNILNLLKEAIDNSTYPNNNKIDIQLDIGSSVPKEAIIDYRNISDALKIFIGNAIRFSPERSRVKIQVETYKEKKGMFLQITIQDFGEGMSTLQLKNLFTTLLTDEEHTPESRYRKPSVQLSQAKMRVEASGGSLTVKSLPNQGTTVFVTVPFRFSYANKGINRPLHQTTIQNNPAPVCSILFIEDDPAVRSLTEADLKILGHQVEAVSNGIDAVALALQNEYDLVLVDISLPDITGLDVIRRIKKAKPGQDLIFIGVTSHAAEEDEDYFISQGMMTVLTKPVSRQKFKECIEAALQVRKHLNDEE